MLLLFAPLITPIKGRVTQSIQRLILKVCFLDDPRPTLDLRIYELLELLGGFAECHGHLRFCEYCLDLLTLHDMDHCRVELFDDGTRRFRRHEDTDPELATDAP